MRTSLRCMLGLPVGVLLAVASVRAQTPSPPHVAPSTGVSPGDLVRRAFAANRELAAARLDLERGRARLRQAGLRPNPAFAFEQITGRLTGAPEERELTVGLVWPVEVGGRRQRRIDVATAELSVIEAEIANRERELTRDVLTAYVDAMAAIRELDITDRMHRLDDELASVVRTRVEAQDAAPLELSLMLTEVARLQARRALIQGRLDAALINIARLIGAPEERLALQLPPAALDAERLPTDVDTAVAAAMDRRADLAMARLSEQAAEAGVRLARAEAWPEVEVAAGYRTFPAGSEFPGQVTLVGEPAQVLVFAGSVGLPFFNRNQGGRAEATVHKNQARLRRELTEQTVRAEVISALRRAEAARTALTLFEDGVLMRWEDNIRVIRAAYELGDFRITDVITQQRRMLEAQQEYTDAMAERYRAIVDLRAAIGLTGLQP